MVARGCCVDLDPELMVLEFQNERARGVGCWPIMVLAAIATMAIAPSCISVLVVGAKTVGTFDRESIVFLRLEMLKGGKRLCAPRPCALVEFIEPWAD